MADLASQKLAGILMNASSETVSSLLTDLIIACEELGREDIGRWAKLECYGYHSANPAWNNDEPPKYRTVRGNFIDQYRRPIEIRDSRLDFLSEYPLGHEVSGLEELLKATSKELYIQHPNLQQVNETFNPGYPRITASSFVVPVSEVRSILSAIRARILENVRLIRKETGAAGNVFQKASLTALHPKVVDVAGTLYEDGHYRAAILDTYIALVEAVKSKSGCELDGAPLMDRVFSPRNPILRLSTDSDEQLGFMTMFKGAVLGIRNPKAHKLVPQQDPQKAFEWLAFASVLFRILDEAILENGQG